MTATRQERKPRPRNGRAALAFAMVAAAWWFGGDVGRAAVTERVVSHYFTGLAIGGFDPVAYFVDSKPSVGRAEVELRHAGTIWRFRNEGNRSAFAADPEVYMPRFGGYDPVAVARGASAPGHPQVWLVVRDRLYLFYSEANRDAFAADPGYAVDAAERRWPEVMQTLVP